MGKSSVEDRESRRVQVYLRGPDIFMESCSVLVHPVRDKADPLARILSEVVRKLGDSQAILYEFRVEWPNGKVQFVRAREARALGYVHWIPYQTTGGTF